MHRHASRILSMVPKESRPQRRFSLLDPIFAAACCKIIFCILRIRKTACDTDSNCGIKGKSAAVGSNAASALFDRNQILQQPVAKLHFASFGDRETLRHTSRILSAMSKGSRPQRWISLLDPIFAAACCKITFCILWILIVTNLVCLFA